MDGDKGVKGFFSGLVLGLSVGLVSMIAVWILTMETYKRIEDGRQSTLEWSIHQRDTVRDQLKTAVDNNAQIAARYRLILNELVNNATDPEISAVLTTCGFTVKQNPVPEETQEPQATETETLKNTRRNRKN